MADYGLGLDTGGTYTDAVIMDLSSGRVVCSAKALTTRHDLSSGISSSLDGFDPSLFRDIRLVSLSSTLATNSIVEGKGCRVALVSIGREFDGSIPVDEYRFINGGHDLSGREAEPLDEQAAADFFRSVKGKVDAVSVAGYLSVRNPDHEDAIRWLASDILDVPVVCGHQLSSGLGFQERTVTCIMNARLLPIIRELMDSVKAVMEQRGIDAPVMVVRGDGSLMSEDVALERPIETILSGPAASMVGAKYLTGLKDAIVMDMGGTTTDIGILRNGSPRLEKEGAVIGGRRTRVLAAEISTSGIGGDSRILVDGGRMELCSLRIVPLCIAAEKWPVLMEKLAAAAGSKPRFTPQCTDRKNIIQDIEFFTMLKDGSGISMSEHDRRFLEAIKDEPRSLSEAGTMLGIHPFLIDVHRLEEIGLVQRIGLTPTDILHGERSFIQHRTDASDLGIMYMSARMKMDAGTFISYAKQRVVDKIAEELLKKLIFEETGVSRPDNVAMGLLSKAITGRDGEDFGCSIRVNKPIIGIGAPVQAYLPAVAEKFGTRLYVTEESRVGNAIGAITGSIVESVTVSILPKKGSGGAEDPGCTVFSPFGRFDFYSYSEALEFIRDKACSVVSERAVSAGADSVEVSLDVDEKRFGFDRDTYGDSSLLIETKVTATAVGKPRQFASACRSA